MKNSRTFYSATPEQAERILMKHPDAYERVAGAKGDKLLKFYVNKSCYLEDSQKINIAEVGHPPAKHKKDKNGEWIMEGKYCPYPKPFYDETNSRQFYHEVQVLKGVEIRGGSDWDLPIYASFMIYENFSVDIRNQNLSRKIIQGAGQVADCGYYYQDGSQAFYENHLEWMARYIEHKTDLDVVKFREFLELADKSGPGFIQDLACWVEDQTGIAQYVENKPNIMNVVVGLDNLLKHGRISYREGMAIANGLTDREICEDYQNILNKVAVQRRASKKKK